MDWLVKDSGTWDDLYLDGSGLQLTIASDRVMTFDILIVGHSSAGESAGYSCQGVIKNDGGTTTLLIELSSDNHEDVLTWDVRLAGDNTNDLLRILVQGNGENIRWVATVRAEEVGW